MRVLIWESVFSPARDDDFLKMREERVRCEGKRWKNAFELQAQRCFRRFWPNSASEIRSRTRSNAPFSREEFEWFWIKTREKTRWRTNSSSSSVLLYMNTIKHNRCLVCLEQKTNGREIKRLRHVREEDVPEELRRHGFVATGRGRFHQTSTNG